MKVYYRPSFKEALSKLDSLFTDPFTMNALALDLGEKALVFEDMKPSDGELVRILLQSHSVQEVSFLSNVFGPSGVGDTKIQSIDIGDISTFLDSGLKNNQWGASIAPLIALLQESQVFSLDVEDDLSKKSKLCYSKDAAYRILMDSMKTDWKRIPLDKLSVSLYQWHNNQLFREVLHLSSYTAFHLSSVPPDRET